jgi:hypothetical protein
MISDMNDIRRWIELYATGKTIGSGSYQDLINCIPFLGNTSFGLGITCSAVGTVTPERFPATTQLAGDGHDDSCVDKLPG